MTADEPGWEGLRDLVARAVALTKPDRPVERRLATTERDLEDRPPPPLPRSSARAATPTRRRRARGARGWLRLHEKGREAARRRGPPPGGRGPRVKPKAALPEHGSRGTAVDGPADRAAGRPFQGDGGSRRTWSTGGTLGTRSRSRRHRWSRPVPPWVQSILGTLVDGREFSPRTSGRGMGPTSPSRTRVSTSASDDAAARPRHGPSKSCDPASIGGAARENAPAGGLGPGRACPQGSTGGPRPVDKLTNAAAGELLGQACPERPCVR